MNRKIITTFIVFGFLQSAFSLVPNAVLLQNVSLGKLTSSHVAYERLCQEQSIPNFSEFQSNWSQYCEILKKSEMCKHVEKEHQLNCRDKDDIEIDILSWDFLSNCGAGMWDGLVELIEFLVAAGKWVLDYSFDGEFREQSNEAFGEYYDTLANYFLTEVQKEMDKGATEREAKITVSKTIASKVFTELVKYIKKEYYSLGCYNPGQRSYKICKVIGEFVLPPVAAVAFLVKGVKAAKRYKNLQSIVDDVKSDPTKAKREITDKHRLKLIEEDSRYKKILGGTFTLKEKEEMLLVIAHLEKRKYSHKQIIQLINKAQKRCDL